MRLLYITQSGRYMNPTNELFIRELAKRPGVVLAGPGFDDDYRSVARLAQRHGKFDLILADFWAKSDYYSWFSFPMVDDLWDYGAPVIISGMMMDVHSLPQELLVDVLGRADAFISAAASPQFLRDWMAEGCTRESYFNPDVFVVKNQHLIDHRFVLMPHAMDAAEFYPLDWRRKKYDVTVTGAKYWYRQQARAHLAAQGRFRVGTLETLYHKVISRAMDINVKYRPTIIDRQFRQRFVDFIRRSRVSVTCDGTIGYAIRKYFEIPAYGTLLAGRFFKEPQALGFRDRENCLILSDDMADLDRCLDFITSDSVAAQRITQAGQDMVRDLHMIPRRVDQFWTLAQSVANRRFAGSRWQDGTFQVIET